MTANLYQKRGTWQYCFLYYTKRPEDNTPDNMKPIKGLRRQKWIDTELPSTRAYKTQAKQMEQGLFEEWGWRLEPWNYSKPSNLMAMQPQVEIAPPAREPKHDKQKDMLFADLLLEWLEQKKDEVQISTFLSYQQTVLGKIEPFFRQELTWVSAMTSDDISEFYHLCYHGDEKLPLSQQKPIKATTLCHYHTYIKQALDLAVNKRLLPFNPALMVKKPRKETFHSDIYTEREVEGLFKAFRYDPLFVPVVIGIYCGLRKSEVIGLEWSAINFRSKTISLKQVAYRHKEIGSCVEQRIKYEMKSKSSYRTMPLPHEVEKILQWWKQEIKKNAHRLGANYYHQFDQFVCVHENGDWIKLDYTFRHFQMVLEKNGLPVIRFHDLRHSCASILYNNGIAQRDIKDYLGHAHIATTDIYTHTNYSHKVPTAQKASKVLPSPVL